MILDTRTEFCDAEALNTGGAGSYLVGDVIDTGGDGINFVDDLYLVIKVETTATSGGSATGQFHLVSDAGAAIATDGSATYHYSTSAIAVATLVAGYQVCAIRLPAGEYERYVGVLQTTGTAAFTAGKIDAFLTPNIDQWKAFADAPNASVV